MSESSQQVRGLLPSSEQMETVGAIGTSMAYSAGVACWYALRALDTVGAALVQGFQAARSEK